MKNSPKYAIDSVDHALHLASLLQQEGTLGVTDAAERLGVSASTAHRLFAMLVYRDFAEQGPDRRYRAGKVLRPAEASKSPVAPLRRAALPHMRQLADRVRESINLMVLAGTEVRVVATAECDRTLRAGDRAGRSLPAHATSGGKAILAALPADEVTALYAGVEDVDVQALRRAIGLIQRQGFAINDQDTETGLTAVGVAVRGASGPPAALCLALPTERFDRGRLPTWVGALSAAAARIEHDLGPAS